MRIELLDEECMPYKKHLTDAGYDLRARVSRRLTYTEEFLFPTGVKFAIPPGYCGLVVPRSGMGNKGAVLKNTVGVIDSDYRGEIFVKIKNTDEAPLKIQRGERFAQIIFVPVFLDDLVVVDTLDETERGEGGFNSTGVE